ncbi:pyridoxal phosphate-dependent transferase [Gorgonomyces haynaldii]|nr:pyridoxal phosphate-dependent transferase [Gorgonomyces haynaldii]
MQQARDLDAQHPNLRAQFHIPVQNGKEIVYFVGNSLGLQPKITQELVDQELQVWRESAVVGHHAHKYNRRWVDIDEHLLEESAKIVGAQVPEVAIMNTLTVNLHLMMVSFYRPTPKRFKILMEHRSFPSDYFAIASQVQMHNLDPASAIIQVKPREGEYCLRTEDILEIIQNSGDEIALILFSGVQYYTGQYFDIPTITKKGQEKGCFVGWDLAHAVGNVHLKLHEWQVDFACWCTYKYLNSGPGNIGGAFIHEKHHGSNLKRLAGWWGQNPETKFDMTNEFEPIPGANGYRLSNPSVLCCISLYGSLQVFKQTSMEALVARSKLLTGYLESQLLALESDKIKIITPSDPKQRGAQLSVLFLNDDMMNVFEGLQRQGIHVDERKPNVIRVSPAPLYNTFEDIYKFVTALKQLLQ